MSSHNYSKTNSMKIGVDNFSAMGREIHQRPVFWILGLFLGAITAYTTRYYINGDAITYFDMAAAFRMGDWKDATNLTYSPGYPILLAILGVVFQSTNYLFLAKGLNLICFIFAMLSCDLLVTRLGKLLRMESPGEALPEPLFASICFSVFLLCAIGWVRLQVVSPDMMVFAIILCCSLVLLEISSSPDRFYLFAALGFLMGLGYVFKTFFLPFSILFFVMAVGHCRSISFAIPRLLVAITVMLSIASPVIVCQSYMAGKFSYGEAGNYNYAHFVAGQGERIHKAEVIHAEPLALSYDRSTTSTYPKGADPGYWNLGVRPALDVKAQISAIIENLDHMLGRIIMPTLAVILWFVIQVWNNTIARISLIPPSPATMLSVTGLAGIFMYCLVVMEIRYIAPFAFLGLVALVSLPRYNLGNDTWPSRIFLESGLLIAFLIVILAQSTLDQSVRGLYEIDGKKSHRELYMESQAMKDFLNSKGISSGNRVAIVLPFNQRLHWASLAGVRITAEFPEIEEYLKSDPASREAASIALGKAGIKAVVGSNPLLLEGYADGWQRVPGTSSYYASLVKHVENQGQPLRP